MIKDKEALLLKKPLRCALCVLPVLAIVLLLACDGQPDLTPTATPPAIAPATIPIATPTVTPQPTLTPQPTVTPYPAPAETPTATPPPTPEPEPSPAQYLNWFDSPDGDNQAAAAEFIQAIWNEDAELGAVVSQFPWAGDGISQGELLRLDQIAFLSAKDLGLTRKVLQYPWVANETIRFETESLDIFRQILDIPGVADSGLIENLAGSRWVADGFKGVERDALVRLYHLLETAERLNFDILNQLASSSWLTDRIFNRDLDVLWRLRVLLELSDAADSNVAEKLIGYPWVTDGIIPDELDALSRIHELLELDGRRGTEFTDRLSQYPWFTDDITHREHRALWKLKQLAEIDARMGSDLVDRLLEYPWLADEVDPVELAALISFQQLLDSKDAARSEFSKTLASYPWVRDGGGITLLEGSSLYKLTAWIPAKVDLERAQRRWIHDGLDGKDWSFLTVLLTAKHRSEHQYRNLFKIHYGRVKTISLPLAGETDLAVIRHSRFPSDDNSLELMEDMARALEGFMEVPFPRTLVVIGIIEYYNPDSNLAVPHEMTHIYWGGHTGAPPWFTEGAAGFLPDYARELTGVQTIEERRKELLHELEVDCYQRGVENIWQMKLLEKRNHEEYQAFHACNYAFGELFLMETYRLLGHDATAAAMRELYLQYGPTGTQLPAGVNIPESRIYQAFLSNAPQEKKEAFRQLYGRIHGAPVSN